MQPMQLDFRCKCGHRHSEEMLAFDSFPEDVRTAVYVSDTGVCAFEVKEHCDSFGVESFIKETKRADAARARMRETVRV